MFHVDSNGGWQMRRKLLRIDRQAYLISKRLFDIFVSLLISILFIPIMLLVCLAIKIDSRGPLVIGVPAWKKKGEKFKELKFRTMFIDADKMFQNDHELQKKFFEKFKLINDPRVTRIGRFLRKTSINELPQLLNILKWEMSFVGPRTIAIDEIKRYGPKHKILFKVKPGLTGLWQINGRQDTTYEQRIEMDMTYIRNRNFLFDIVLFLKTIWVVLTTKGAY